MELLGQYRVGVWTQ